MEEKIKKVLAELQPHLQADGGDVEFVSFDKETGVLKLKLVGACLHCPMAQVTLQDGIGQAIKKEVPEVKTVEAV